MKIYKIAVLIGDILYDEVEHYMTLAERFLHGDYKVTFGYDKGTFLAEPLKPGLEWIKWGSFKELSEFVDKKWEENIAFEKEKAEYHRQEALRTNNRVSSSNFKIAWDGDHDDNPEQTRKQKAWENEQSRNNQRMNNIRGHLLTIQDIAIRYRSFRDGQPTTDGYVQVRKQDIHDLYYHAARALEKT